MGRGSEELEAAAADYVCVRITDMSEVDLGLIELDFDLTFAAVLMHADGTIYHRYGGRGPDDASGYLSLSSLARLLRDTVGEHRRHDQGGAAPAARPARRAIDLPVLQRKIAAGQKLDCVHCHTVNDARYAQAVTEGTWRREQQYVFPDPERVGLTLDREHQRRITAVREGSPAAKAGLARGDELLALGEQRSVRTLADVQWALHRAPWGDNALPVRFRSGKLEVERRLDLDEGWKVCPPEDYAWRPYKWNLSPAPGFGGPVLDAAAKKEVGIDAGTFAMRVSYLVDWGERAHRGRAARAAGLRKGDVVVSFAGKRDFMSFDHLHAWVALTLRAGQHVEIGVWRDGATVTLRYELPE